MEEEDAEGRLSPRHYGQQGPMSGHLPPATLAGLTVVQWLIELFPLDASKQAATEFAILALIPCQGDARS